MTHSGRSAIIVGAGIGGLTAALVLARFGWRVTVLEQAAVLTEMGAGIQISPNASRVLNWLGLGKQIDLYAFRPQSIEMRQWRNGWPVFQTGLGDGAVRQYGAPYLHLHRADLLEVLAGAVQKSGAVEMRLGSRFTSLEQDAARVCVRIEGGAALNGDLVVGADGLRSMVQTALFGAESPRFTGVVAWRGVIPAERLMHLKLPPNVSNWMGPGAHFVHYFIRSGSLVNFVAVQDQSTWQGESWTERGDKDDLVRVYEDWHPTVRGIVAQADAEACYKWALMDRKPLPSWSVGRVVLLGDACHPMLPFMAQGAASAIEDAAILGRCLDGSGTHGEALTRYAQVRRPRVDSIQRLSRGNKYLYHLRGPMAWARNMGGPMIPMVFSKLTNDLFSYDAVGVDLGG